MRSKSIVIFFVCLILSGSLLCKPLRSSDDIWIEETSQVCRDIGIYELSSRIEPQGQSDTELRIWIGSGFGYPQKLLSVKIKGDKDVSGQLYLWWPGYDRSASEALRARFECKEFVHGIRYGICMPGLSQAPDWREILNSLESNSVWSLAEQPHHHIVLDGNDVLIQRLEAGKYSHVLYLDPDLYNSPLDRKAKAISDVVERLYQTVSLKR